MEDIPESEKHFGRVGVEFGGAVDFDLGDVGGGEGEGEVGGGEVAVGGGHLFGRGVGFNLSFCWWFFLDCGRCYVSFSWKGWVEKVMFVYSKCKCSSRGVQVSRGVENDKMKQLIVLGVVMKTS